MLHLRVLVQQNLLPLEILSAENGHRDCIGVQLDSNPTSILKPVFSAPLQNPIIGFTNCHIAPEYSRYLYVVLLHSVANHPSCAESGSGIDV